jgi:hypothetical protein
MSKRSAARVSMVLVAALFVTLLAAVPAFAAETSAAPTATTIAATATAGTAAEGEGAAAEGAANAAAEGETKAGEKAEIPHVVGHPSEAQLQELRDAWSGIPGYDILIVSILGMVITVGIIGFAAYKQSRV